MTPEHIAQFTARYEEIIQAGLDLNPRAVVPDGAPKRGRVKQSKTRNLLERLHGHQAAVLSFMRGFRVPYTNNQAEQDIRMIKVHPKIAGAFRSTTGANMFCRIRRDISTLKKRGLPVWKCLQEAFGGRPYLD